MWFVRLTDQSVVIYLSLIVKETTFDNRYMDKQIYMATFGTDKNT
jgi:hypothetical protein